MALNRTNPNRTKALNRIVVDIKLQFIVRVTLFEDYIAYNKYF